MDTAGKTAGKPGCNDQPGSQAIKSNWDRWSDKCNCASLAAGQQPWEHGQLGKWTTQPGTGSIHWPDYHPESNILQPKLQELAASARKQE